MTYSIKVLAPAIWMYEDVIDFSATISKLCAKDHSNWKSWIMREGAVELGDKIVKYDEYPVSFDFSVNENFLILSKRISDVLSDYGSKNLIKINAFDSIVIRRYSPNSSFLELELPDFEKTSRRATSILFLDDAEKETEITFKNFDLSVSPKRGAMIVFPASFAYAFKINKPKESDKLFVVSHFV